MTVFVNLGFHQEAVQTIKLDTMPYIIIIITIETAKVTIVSDIIFCPFFHHHHSVLRRGITLKIANFNRILISNTPKVYVFMFHIILFAKNGNRGRC